MNRNGELRSLAALFLKLGVIGFGGLAAHIALMREEVAEKRGRTLFYPASRIAHGHLVVWFRKLNSAFLVAGGALAGYLLSLY